MVVMYDHFHPMNKFRALVIWFRRHQGGQKRLCGRIYGYRNIDAYWYAGHIIRRIFLFKTTCNRLSNFTPKALPLWSLHVLKSRLL